MPIGNPILHLVTGSLVGSGLTLLLLTTGPAHPWFAIGLVVVAIALYRLGYKQSPVAQPIPASPTSRMPPPEMFAVMDAMQSPLVFLDSQGAVGHANPPATELLGTHLEALRGIPWQVQAPLSSTSAISALDGAEGHPANPPHAVELGAWGRLVFLDAHSDESGASPPGAMEEQRDEARAESLAKSLFLVGMGHELRSPLNAMLGYSEMLLQETEDIGRHDMSRDLTRVLVAGHHLLDRITGMVELAKLDAGQMEIFNEVFSIHDLMLELQESGEALASHNRNRLEIKQPDTDSTLCTDRLRLRQALGHLINNACRFTHQGVVTVQVSVEDADQDADPTVCFSVSDNGTGMSPAQLEAAFGSRDQDLDPLRRERMNQGLGALITCKFVQMLQGTLDVSSTPGEGTTVTITLPRRPPSEANTALSGEESDISASLGPATAARAAHGMMVVISENQDEVLRLQNDLAPIGFTLLSASSSTEALQLARDMEPSVILLDAGMQGLDSWATLHRLKQDPTTGEIPTILFSCDGPGDRGLCLGPADFVQKPLTQQDLLRVINRTLQGQPSGTILVIDDDIAVREWIRGYLLTSGWKIQTAHEGPDAMKKIWSQRPALVIADLLMPKMDGFEFLIALRARAAMRQLPVVLMSSINLDRPSEDRLGQKLTRTMALHAQGRDEWLGDLRAAIMAATRGQ